MSTRCNIRINQKSWNCTLMLYHHFDGYPSGVGMCLKKYLNTKTNWYATGIANELIKDKAGLDDDGYETTYCMHTDIEYLYVIDCDEKTLKCYKSWWDANESAVINDNNIIVIKDEAD